MPHITGNQIKLGIGLIGLFLFIVGIIIMVAEKKKVMKDGKMKYKTSYWVGVVIMVIGLLIGLVDLGYVIFKRRKHKDVKELQTPPTSSKTEEQILSPASPTLPTSLPPLQTSYVDPVGAAGRNPWTHSTPGTFVWGQRQWGV